MKAKWFASAVALMMLLLAQGAGAQMRVASPSRGQLVYVPVYSLIYFGDREHKFNLAVTLSVRNTDPENAIRLGSVEYHGEDGKLIRSYLREPAALAPLETRSIVIRESDTTGGAGASYLVSWSAETPVSPPLIETVMIGTQHQQGMSFTSRGVAVRELSR